MRTAELEVVSYNKPEIINTSTRLIYSFANYSDLRGAEAWPLVLFNLIRTVRDELPEVQIWRAEGVTAFFSGIPAVSPELRDGKIIYSAQAPHFVLEENIAVDLPRSVRNNAGKVIDEISFEMGETYKMDVVKNGLYRTLWFPKNEYAERIERFEVPAIGTP